MSPRRAVPQRCVVVAVAAVAGIAGVAGCGWRGMNSLPLPGTEGNGPGAYTVLAQLPDVATIQQNSRVRVGDVNVGTVTKIELQDWHALVTMRINGDVHLPANSIVRVGPTIEYMSWNVLGSPTSTRSPAGRPTRWSPT